MVSLLGLEKLTIVKDSRSFDKIWRWASVAGHRSEGIVSWSFYNARRSEAV